MANFDGFPVDHYQARMSGVFDIEPGDGETLMRFGNKVMLVVLATVGAANMAEDKTGDIRRLNTLAVEAARFVAPEDQSNLLAELGVAHQLGLLAPVVAKKSEGTAPELVATPDGYVDDQGELVGSPVSEAPAARIGVGDDGWYDEETPVDGVIARIPPPKDPRLARFLDEAGAPR